MASSTKIVQEFLNEILEKSIDLAKNEIQTLQ